jgi:cell division inhibitor SepF
MTTLHRVKAYFGMVPADELDSYDGYDDRYDGRDRHPADRHSSDRYRYDRYDDRYESRYEGRQDRYEARDSRDVRDTDDRRARYGSDDRDDRHDRYDDPRDRRTPRPRDPEVTEIRRDDEPATESVSRAGRGRSWAANTGPSHTSVRPTTPRTPPSLSSTSSSGPSGSTASGASGSAGSSAATSTSSVSSLPSASAKSAAPATPKAAPEPDPVSAPAEITSLQPTSYNEARLIGERYRDGIPVIINLTEMDDVGAKRLVDFAAGLAFALRGSIEKVTNRVFLLSPPNVEVSADDRRKLAEKNFAKTS